MLRQSTTNLDPRHATVSISFWISKFLIGFKLATHNIRFVDHRSYFEWVLSAASKVSIVLLKKAPFSCLPLGAAVAHTTPMWLRGILDHGIQGRTVIDATAVQRQ
jgi:hypothetical protein